MTPPTRAQWAGLTWVVRAAASGRRSSTAGNKRSAAAMERKGWIRWFSRPEARSSGYEITSAGRAAFWVGQRKYGVDGVVGSEP